MFLIVDYELIMINQDHTMNRNCVTKYTVKLFCSDKPIKTVLFPAVYIVQSFFIVLS